MKTLLRTVLCLVVAGMLGCDPEQVVVWSPDGSRAAVIGGDGLHVADSSGKLSGVLVKDVRKAAWFSDSIHVVLAREVKVSNWKEACKYLEAERIKKLEAEGEKL